ncbi:MAG: SprB repeat-containing protein, partial [Flavobacteriales bacterium]|nr:SprB repeat-containing protein [Flavobacteriales bacterium]
MKFYRDLIQTEWIGANKNVKIIPVDKYPDYYSYSFRHNDQVKNINHIPGYKKIVYKELYPKIDVEFVFHPEGGIKYSFILHPGADLSQVKIKYTTAHSNTKRENTSIQLNRFGQLDIKTSLGDILEHKPVSFYSKTKTAIKSNYVFKNNILTFELDSYDKTQEVIIDPWVVSPAFNSSTAVWEVETDGAGNVYVIGGETPMELKKYNSAGIIQWTYSTPWDTSNVWLGTLATDVTGTSYITAGVSPEMERINTAATMVWHSNNAGGALGQSDEMWSITFNCDHTKLIVGGTKGPPLLGFDFYAAIYEIDLANGNLLDSMTFAKVTVGGIGATPEEVRSLTSSRNAKYVFLTHNQVGAINEDFGLCPTNDPIFRVNNTHNLGYKCENYLPETQNGGGLKAIAANDNYYYTHAGDQIHRWDLNDGTLINSATIPGGTATGGFGGIVVSNSGLDVDSCGNVYAGSMNTVVQYDSALNIVSQASVAFTVYDVSVSSNGEILAVGAQNPNNNANRNGRIEAVNMNACTQYTLVCCDASICPVGPFCDTDPIETLISSTPGGVWSGPGITSPSAGTFDPSIPGSGSFTIVYTLGCGSDQITIDVSGCAPLTICQENNGDLTVSGGTGPYTWQEEVTTTDCSACFPAGNCGFPPGCDVTVTSWNTFATGATATPPGTFPIQVYENPLSPLVITSLAGIPACSPCGITSTTTSTPETCVGNDGTTTVNATGGALPYAYSWNTTPTQTNQTATGLSSGTYTVIVTDATSCTDTVTVMVSGGGGSLTATPTAANASCTGTCNGSATAIPANGTAPYSYLWDASAGSQTTQLAIGLCAGTYSVTVTDGGGCTFDTVVVVNEPAALTISITSSAISCNGGSDGSATATPGGGASPYQYNWSDGQFTSTASGLDVGTYIVTVTDNNSCTDTGSVVISQPAGMGPTVTENDASCGAADGSATVTLSGGTAPFTYLWSNGQATSSDTGLVAGLYTVTITDASGCSETATAVINTIGGPTLTMSFSDVTCNGSNDGTGLVTATGGAAPYTYLWSDTMAQTTAAAAGLSGGSFNVSVSDTAGCVAIGTITILEPSSLNLTLNSTPASCGLSDGSANAIVTGGTGTYTFLWSPSGGTTNTESNISSGTYTLLVSDSNSCFLVDSIVVTNTGGPVPIITDSTNASCFSVSDGSATVSVSGGSGPLTYSWSPSGGNGTIATGLGPGTYTVTVTDSGGCVSTVSTLIASPPDIVLTMVSNNISCPGNTDGSAAVTAVGGVGSFTYLWSPNGETSLAISNLAAGSYSVLVTDANGCTNSDSVIISTPSVLSIALLASMANCGVSDGSATVAVLGGASPYTYLWSPFGGTAATTVGIPAGVYTVSVTDAGGCSAIDSVIVNNIGGQTASILTSVNATCSGDNDGSATVDVTGGTTPYLYFWSTSPVQTNTIATGLTAGIYNCTVTDAASCISIVQVTITEPALIIVTVDPDSTVCPFSSFDFSAYATGGTQPYVFGWNNLLSNGPNQTVTITQDTSFTVNVTDINNCGANPAT